MPIIIGISLNFLYMAKYKYGQNELDLQNLITNLSNNVDSYVQSKTDWSQAQKESFKEGYRNYITGLQDQLNNNTDRFSADEFGTITDKQGQIKNNTDTDYVYNKKGELLDPTTTSEKKLKKGTPFYRNQEVAIFNNIIAKGMVDKMKEEQQNIPSLADYWQQQYNPKGDLADYASVAALDKEGEYTNRIAEIKGLWDRYKQKYQLSPEQTAKYDALINSLSTDNIGSDKWKNQIIRDSAAAGIGKFLTGYLGFNTPEPEKAFDINNDEDVIKRYQLEEQIRLHPELRNTLVANARAQYNAETQAILDQDAANKKQQANAAYQQKLNEFWKQNPALFDVHKRQTKDNFSIGVVTGNKELSDRFSSTTGEGKGWNDNINQTFKRANKTGDYFYTPLTQPITLTTGHKITNLGQLYSYLFPYLEQNNLLTSFDRKQDKAGNTVYRLKDSKNKNGEWLYMFYHNGKLRTYRSKSYQDLLPKAQEGLKFETARSLRNKQQTAATKARAQATGKTYQQQKAADTVNQELTGADKARLAGVVLDIGSMIAAYAPGYGTAISAAAGLGSTAANLGADLSDGTMSTWDAFKNAGINIGFDALGLFGGVGKGGKIAKTLVRYAPRVLAAVSTAEGLKNAPEITASFKKLINKGYSTLTVQDWQNISQGIGLVTGIGGAAGRKIKQHNNTIQGNKVGVRFKDKKTGESKIFTFEGNDAKAIRNAKNDAEIQTITNKYKELKGFELQHVNKLSGLHWKGMKDSNTSKYQLPVTTQSQKTQLYDVYSNGKVTWTNKEGIRGWLQPYGGQTIDARHSLLSDDSKLSNKILSSAGSAIDSFGQALHMATNNQGVTGLPAIIGTPTPYKPYQGDFGFLDKRIAFLQRQNKQRQNVISNIDDSINRRQKQIKDKQMQNTQTALNRAFAESFSGQIPTTLSSAQKKRRREIREAFAKDTGQRSVEAIKRANDVLNAIIYNKSRTQLATIPKLQFNLPPIIPYKFNIPNQYNGAPSFMWDNRLALPAPQVKKIKTSKKSKLQKAKNKVYKRGGVIKASTGIKTPWFNGLQPVNKDTDFKSNWDTSTLYAGDTSKGLISPYASTKAGKAIGRYTPTEGYTREQARTVEQGNLYKNFINNLFNEDGTFNEVGEAWAKKVDNLIPHDSTASFYDPKTKKLRTQWVTTNNNIYGGAPKTYTNLRDYVQNVMNDNIIGARHNIFINKGKRYFYKDTNGNIVYVNPQDLSKYNVSDKGNDVFENGTLWSDYELTGLKPEATTFGTNINNEIKKKTSVNISNLLNSLSPTKTYGLARAIAAARNNSRMLSKSITQPVLLDPNEIHRNVYSDLGSEMQGQQQTAELQRLATTQAGADFDRNAAMALDAKLKGIELKDLKFKNSNDLQRQSAEASWAQEKDNKQSRWQTAQTNREAIYENDIANLQRKLATQAQNFQIWDTFAQQLQQEAATDWQVNRARMDSMAENDINSAIRNNIKAYVSDISPEDEQLWNEIQSGKKSSTTLTPTESARFRILSEKANQAKYEQLRQYYKMPKNRWSNYTIGNRVFAPVINLSAKDGGKLQVARLRAATADADRFYKTTKDFADRTERAIARLTTKKKKKKQ